MFPLPHACAIESTIVDVLKNPDEGSILLSISIHICISMLTNWMFHCMSTFSLLQQVWHLDSQREI